MNRKILFLSLILFLVAFFPRAYRLDLAGINPDEDTWHERIDNFIAAVREGNWFYTQQSLHPGVTFEWLTAGGKVLLGGNSFWPNHYAMVWPIVLVTSFTVVGIYLLLLKLFDPLTSFAASLLIALDPFFIAHSRVVQMDALLASFMILSALSFLVFQKENSRKYLVFSAVMGGLAILTKLPALFLVPYVVLILSVDWSLRRRDGACPVSTTVATVMMWFAVAGVTFVALYPAMWVDPILTVKNLIYGLVGRGLTAEGAGMERPGILFYPIVLALRSTPVSLVFGVFGGIWGVWEFLKKKRTVLFFLISYSLFFLLQMTIVAKAGDRYLLPAFLGLDILAGYGISKAGYWILDIKYSISIDSKNRRLRTIQYQIISMVLLFTFCFLFLFPLNSCYLTYYNPLFGGGKAAEKLMVVGWGEGLREAAEYLNQKPDAGKLKVAAFYPDGLQPYFTGEAWDICSQGDGGADYAVLYVNMIQRKRCSEFVEKYYENPSPEKVINLNGINYAWIYKTY